MTAAQLSAASTRAGQLQRARLGLLRQHEATGELGRHARRRDDRDVVDAMKRLRDAGDPLGLGKR